MTTTELASNIDRFLNGALLNLDLLKEAAQRLRELDKPDCVWVKDEHDCFNTQCGDYFDLEHRRFCPSCGGAVKEST